MAGEVKMPRFAVGTWDNLDDAFKALQKEAYNPSPTHRKLHHAVTEGEKVAKDVATAVAAAIITPVAVITLPAFAALAATVGIAGVVEFAGGVVQEAYEGFKDSKDLPKVHGQDPVLLQRNQIMSTIHPDKKLSDLAGDRRGTRGPVYVKDVLEGIVPHYIAAKRNWTRGPFKVNSCQAAEDLYRVFAETDYHLSKMFAYAKALRAFADTYVKFCEDSGKKVKGAYDNDAKPAIDAVLNHGKDWHERNCHVTDHCYRTHKASRMFTKKAA